MNNVYPFNFVTTPNLHFGAGKVTLLPSLAKKLGRKLLLITGARSFSRSSASTLLLQQLRDAGIEVETHPIGTEPTPGMIDEAVKKFSSYNPNVVVAIGGGSVLDAGKAISAMLPLNEPVKDYLEGVGSKSSHPGTKIPFIAVPTTAGTGSEATKNAVLSETGDNGYKRSLRHNNFIPDFAIVDPTLTATCSAMTTATSGMDAFTQLLESYLSGMSNPMTDALALEGLRYISSSLITACREGDNPEARSGMSLAAYLSGVTLANAGLGLVHGFASPIGGYFNIPHGVICSSLMAAANKITVEKLRREKKNPYALHKYATAGKLFTPIENRPDAFYADVLINTIAAYTSELNIPHLDIPESAFDKIVQATDNKYNPVALEKDEMKEVLTLSIRSGRG